MSDVTSASGGDPAIYIEGERVFGPPQGTYDADWVAASARSKDPGLPEETAREMAVYAWDHLRAIGELDAREQTIAVLLYVEELTLREVGAVVNLSEGRVCQIHRELRGKLRGELGDEAADLFA